MISGVLEMISKVFEQDKLFLANVLIYFLFTLECIQNVLIKLLLFSGKEIRMF